MDRKDMLASSALAAAVIAAWPLAAVADTDTEARIRQLEQRVQEMQQQRAQQDKQIDVLTRELATIRQQVTQARTTKTEASAKTEPNIESEAQAEPGATAGQAGQERRSGSPVYASFKDGLVFDDGSGNWKLQINGRVQADYRGYDPSEWRDDGFTVRRARFGGTFSFLKDFAVRVEGEYANDNTGARSTTAMTYAYLDYAHWKAAKLRVGQFKPFFGLERTYSSNFTDFIELSLATNNGSIFNSTYDRGVMVHGDPLPWINYNAYVVNGSGQNNDDKNDGKDLGGRINANFAQLAGIQDSVIHAGASASKGDVGKTSLTQVTDANGVQFFNVSGLDERADRTRWGLESALAHGPVKLQAEYIHANFEGVKGGTAFDRDIKAWYADINWLVTGESWANSYKSGVFGRLRPKHDFDGNDGWGAFELGLRYSRYDGSGFRNLLASATANASEASAWTLGAKWILNPNARVLLNYVYTNFDQPTQLTINGRTEDKEQAVLLRGQYDF